MKMIKTLLSAVLVGAATYVGYSLAEDGIRTVKDPYKRAAFKRKFNEIKRVIFKKGEES